MGEEKMRILKMLENKKISAEQAANLLDALGTNLSNASGSGKKCLKIRVYDTYGPYAKGPLKVNISIPLELIDSALKFVPEDVRETMEDSGINMQNVRKMVEANAENSHIEVTNEDDERIVVSVE